MKDGFLRVAAATPDVKVADPRYNVAEMEKQITEAARAGCGVVVFPELAVTAYTCGDLFKDNTLLWEAENSLKQLMENTQDLDVLCAAGIPVSFRDSLYNCTAVFIRGRLLGLAAKTFIPNYSEFYEFRHFAPGMACDEIIFCGQKTCIGTDLLFACENVAGFLLGVEICEDLWASAPPSIKLVQSGATVICNPSCSNELVGKAAYRRDLVKVHSGQSLCAYIYADSGLGESTTDMVFAGHNLVAENGSILAESGLFTKGLTIAELDLERIRHERTCRNTWKKAGHGGMQEISFSYLQETLQAFAPDRCFPRYPFVPDETGERESRCELILTMQAAGLATRLKHIGCKTVVLGLSGGLDSTLALLVTARAFAMLELDKKGIVAISMPCFGTTDRTKNNAASIAGSMGVTFHEISIKKAVEQHFKDIGHSGDVFDITYENAQARERTQVLMDYANRNGGIVVGTGDLSELALGWATYNGDHMSMYGVNASVPKTLVRHLVAYAAGCSKEKLQAALQDVLDTPVSPELLPPDKGEIAQKTEDIVGPYALHDFFLYYMLRFGFTPKKIFAMACRTFEGEYAPDTIKGWLRTFYRRFFSQQFKRSCMPDGPKVGSVSLSPRGDLRMPSDACAAIWLQQIESL